VANKTGGKIPCKPLYKVVEDGLIVGLLTETNQFVPLNAPTENIDKGDGLLAISGSNDIAADADIQNQKTVDETRKKMIRNLHLESQFYANFRLVVRVLMNHPENSRVRKQIHETIHGKMEYMAKMRELESILRKMTAESVDFIDYSEDVLNQIEEVTGCRKNACDRKPYCLMTRDAEKPCKLLIPKTHLIPDPRFTDNERMYYGRIADELIRYKRVQLFLLNPNVYLNIDGNQNREYNVYETETILLQSMLTPDFFEELKDVFEINPFVKTIPYEMAVPKKTQTYTNRITMEEQRMLSDKTVDTADIEMHAACMREQKEIIGNNATYWKNVFPKTCKEWVLTNKRICGYYLFIRIIKEHLRKTVTPTVLRGVLRESYTKLIRNDTAYKNILKLLKLQGKKTWVKLIQQGKIEFDNMIVNDTYYLTELDIWILAEKYDLPMILFATRIRGVSPLKTLGLDVEWLPMGNWNARVHYFIRCPIASESSADGVPSVHMIMPPVPLNAMQGFESKYETQLGIGFKTAEEHLCGRSI
jgi:hypothetical protein